MTNIDQKLSLVRQAMTRTQYKYWKWYATKGKSYTWIARKYGKNVQTVWLTIKRGEKKAKEHLRIFNNS